LRFPSLALLAEHAVAVLRRFPWTLGAVVRLARMLQAPDTARISAREASAALRFLMDHKP
jgi:hypothetical protein